MRVLALPVRVGCRLPTLDEAMAPPPPAKCPPTCVPAAPCLSHLACPGQREAAIAAKSWASKQHGIAANPEPRRFAAPELRAERQWLCDLVRAR
ncbi:MAG: hypothetical protein LC640_08980 [Frankia sp.]|nr:hypothetical protein [Frankia sp.]